MGKSYYQLALVYADAGSWEETIRQCELAKKYWTSEEGQEKAKMLILKALIKEKRIDDAWDLVK